MPLLRASRCSLPHPSSSKRVSCHTLYRFGSTANEHCVSDGSNSELSTYGLGFGGRVARPACLEREKDGRGHERMMPETTDISMSLLRGSVVGCSSE